MASFNKDTTLVDAELVAGSASDAQSPIAFRVAGAKTIPSKGTLPWLIAGTLVVAAGCWFALKPAPSVSPSGKTGNSLRQTPVDVAAVEIGDVEEPLSGLGSVTPLATVTVKSEISGKIRSSIRKVKW
jgi:multidrug efflux system membrane fusion protein